MSIEDKVKEILITHLNLRESNYVTTANIVEDLGADSLDVVELIMIIEEEFSIDIPDEDSEKFETANDVLTYLNKRLK